MLLALWFIHCSAEKNAMQKFTLNISLTFLTLTQHYDTCWETNNVFYVANVCLCPNNF